MSWAHTKYSVNLIAAGFESVNILSVLEVLMLTSRKKSSSILHTFILAMILYAEVQAKGQAEIDSVIGATSRLPKFDDRPLLPYVDAILRELLRWIPVVPLG